MKRKKKKKNIIQTFLVSDVHVKCNKMSGYEIQVRTCLSYLPKVYDTFSCSETDNGIFTHTFI